MNGFLCLAVDGTQASTLENTAPQKEIKSSPSIMAMSGSGGKTSNFCSSKCNSSGGSKVVGIV